ncbi:MAG: GLUG motif-containing protein, partial [Muribaculaceae bacterium]
MNKLIKSIIASCLLVTLIAIVSCGDDLMYKRNEIGSELTENSEYKISSFEIGHKLWTIPATDTSIDIVFLSQTDSTEYRLSATVEHGIDTYTIKVMIPKNKRLPDSDYIIKASLADGTPLGSVLLAKVSNEMVHSVLGSQLKYPLSGNGSPTDPYLIKSKGDFDKLLSTLARDTNAHAYGLYFKQTADFEAPAVSNVTDGRLYAGFDFAGIYDGDNHSITLTYQGGSNDKDNQVGLFPKLLDNAMVENLTITSIVYGVKNCGGVLAAESSGHVAINNVHVMGSITGNEHIGALIGKATGTLEVTGCSTMGTVLGKKYVGGIVGSMTGDITVSDFSTDYDDKHLFVVSASESHAGGLIGSFSDGSFKIDDVNVSHTIDESSKDVYAISAPSYCGGLIGEAIVKSQSTISDSKAVAALHSTGNYLGGFIGRAELNADLILKSVKSGVYVNGKNYVGGLFGYVVTNNHLVFQGNNSQNSNIIAKSGNSHCAVDGSQYVGGLFGIIKGDVKPVSTKLNISVTGADSYIGGMAGKAENSTIDCSETTYVGDMKVVGPNAVGGVVGYATSSTIKGEKIDDMGLASMPAASKFKSFCPITVTCQMVNESPVGGTSIGGIVGSADNCTLENLVFSGTVTGIKNVGGIVGQLHLDSKGSLHNCVNNGLKVENIWGVATGGIAGSVSYKRGTISNLTNYAVIQGSDYTGGIIGEFHITSDCPQNFIISMSLNRGAVTGTRQVGGCIGYLWGVATYVCRVKQFGNTADVTSSDNGNVGGIIGYGNKNHLRVLECANHGRIVGKGKSKVGGIAGRLGKNGSGLTGCVNNMEMAFCCNRGVISSDHSQSNVGGLL